MLRSGIVIFLILLFIVPAAGLADSEWHWIHPRPTGASIECIWFLDEDRGWIATKMGEVFGTCDGGLSWENLHKIDVPLYGVFFTDSLTGWVSGDYKHLLHTIDGGENWTVQILLNGPIRAVQFVNSNCGFLAGTQGGMARTTNGGTNWIYFDTGSPYYHFFDLSFVSPSEGWLAGLYGEMLHTVDACSTWTVQNITGSSERHNNVHFVDSEVGFTTYYEDIYRTEDGGDSWASVFQIADVYLDDVDSEGSLAVACGVLGAAVSEDSGATWGWESIPAPPPSQYNCWLRTVSVPEEDCAYSAGNYGFIYKRDSYGVWNRLSYQLNLMDLTSITNFDGDHVWACSESGLIFRSSDGGVTWITDMIDPDCSFDCIVFPSLTTGYCTGRNSGTGGVIFKTVDGGVSWTDITPAAASTYRFSSIDFIDQDMGVAVGSYGTIFYTMDGGSTWIEKTGLIGEDWTMVRFGNSDRGWIVGGCEDVIRFDLLSGDWVVQSPPTFANFEAVFPLNEDTVWAVGYFGTAVVTHNAGAYWEQLWTMPPVIDFTDVWFDSNGLDGYFVSYQDSPFLTSRDGGQTITFSENWALERLVTSIAFINKDYGWGCGPAGTILRYCDYQQGMEEDEYPAQGNSPVDLHIHGNPFSSGTTVSFTLTEQGTVSLILYDLTGHAVQNICSGTIPSGVHEYFIDGAALSAGMYFVRLQAEGAVSTESLVRIP